MTEDDAQDYYDILGVDRSASLEDITLAYRDILSETNTFDVESDHEQETIELIKTVTKAYRILSDEEKRREYDCLLRGEQSPDSEPVTAVYEIEPLSLADTPSLTSSNLEALKDGDGGVASQALTPRVVYEIGQALSPRSEEEIPESWKQERAFFEEHAEEILKPAPKVDLVGASSTVESEESVVTIAEWEDNAPDTPGASRFGTTLDPSEVSQLQAIPTPRRMMARSLVSDPFDLLVYVGLPLMSVILAIEFLVYLR